LRSCVRREPGLPASFMGADWAESTRSVASLPHFGHSAAVVPAGTRLSNRAPQDGQRNS
jgi:hypothetical protein